MYRNELDRHFNISSDEGFGRSTPDKELRGDPAATRRRENQEAEGVVGGGGGGGHRSVGEPGPTGDRRMPALRTPRPHVCRQLFPYEDNSNESLAQDENRANTFLEQLRSETIQARNQWNFDFETETPLEGVWQWERITNDEQPVRRPDQLSNRQNDEIDRNANGERRPSDEHPRTSKESINPSEDQLSACKSPSDGPSTDKSDVAAPPSEPLRHEENDQHNSE